MGAVRQRFRGSSEKVYDIINTFNKGYNTSVADDILDESYFRDLSNMLPSEEGNMTKRPGIKRIGLTKLLETLLKDQVNNIKVNVDGTSNMYSSKQSLTYLYNQLCKLSKLSSSRKETIDGNSYDVSVRFNPDTLINYTILDDANGIIYDIEDFTKCLTDDSWFSKNYQISMLFIFKGAYKESYKVDGVTKYLLDTNGVRIIKLGLDFSKDKDLKNILDIKFEVANPTRSNANTRLQYRYEADDILELAIYVDNLYYMNGYDALTKITRHVDTSVNISNEISEIYADASVIYKPTAIEATRIGFNLLSSNPIEFINNAGSANSIRGVFYTYDGQPTQIVPFNKEFKIHILSSGSGVNQVPKYRPNNGEVDTTVNPYKDLPGSYNSDKTIFTCTGLNETRPLELKIQKGADNATDKTDFLTYFTLGTVPEQQTGKIADTVKLVLKSRYCKVIDSRLVLFGNHGYMFFSDIDNFEYYPNYNYIYVAETENEEVVSVNYFRQFHAVFTNKRIKRMSGSFGYDNFGVYPLNDFIGCINPRSVRQVQNYLYFLSYNGLYILKQGYLGEGSENVEQIDLPIYKSYITENMLKSSVFMNYYCLSSNEEAILYNYATDAYYKFKTANQASAEIIEDSIVYADEYSLYYPMDDLYPGENLYSVYDSKEQFISYDDEIIDFNDYIDSVRHLNYSLPFQYHKLQSYLLYGVIENFSDNSISFDICTQNYSSDSMVVDDNGIPFQSILETPMMSLGTPTNTKKFKSIYLKLYNKASKNIPLYVTIKVDDKVVLSPKDYTVIYDKETETWMYVESPLKLKGNNVLGTLTLGDSPLGVKTMQIIRLKVSTKGRGIKVIVSDGVDNDNNPYSNYENIYKYDLATVGVLYKLKKVKEG